MEIKQLAQEVLPEIIALRQELHRHPEVSMEEFQTTEMVCHEMEALGLSYRRFHPTGLIAELTGRQQGPVVVLRADLDALSITEQTGLPYASECEGVMHACGHDSHTAMLVGAAKILSRCRDSFVGTVRFLFQPAEETGEGARLVIAQGALEQAAMIFGIHAAAQVPVGLMAYSGGIVSAAADTFTIELKGSACHGATPEKGADATVAAAALVMALQTVVSREISAMEPVVLTVGKLVSGSRFNIVSGQARLEGTVRCFSPEVRQQLPAIVTRLAQETAAAYRCEATVSFTPMANFLRNDPGAATIVREAELKLAASSQLVVEAPKQMTSEDFADYTDCCPAAFAMVGVGGDYPHHSDHFFIDEKALANGAALYAQMALDALAALAMENK